MLERKGLELDLFGVHKQNRFKQAQVPLTSYPVSVYAYILKKLAYHNKVTLLTDHKQS